MTWKEFKEKIESQGVTDAMIVDYIDCEEIDEPRVELFGDGSFVIE